jgi:hypothetical protein
MCFETISGHPHRLAAEASELAAYRLLHEKNLLCLYANVRGLRQGEGELKAHVRAIRPHLVMLTETHLGADDPNSLFLPQGYKVVQRCDRSKHGGGLIILAQDHMLVDVLDLAEWHVPDCREMVGIKYAGADMLLCYTPQSSTAPMLFEALEEYRLKHSHRKLVLLGDFNCHSQSWLGSKTTDRGGQMAQEFSEMFGMPQVVDFPTRQLNILDLVFSDFQTTAIELCNIGTSDHSAMLVDIKVCTEISIDDLSIQHEVYQWKLAPWNHIKGAFKREFKDWDARRFNSVDEAAADFDRRCTTVIDRYVKKTRPQRPRATPWWTAACQRTLDQKTKAFSTRQQHGEKFRKARDTCKRVQRRAYATYQKQLKQKLRTCVKSDREFWSITKGVGGLTRERNRAAPPPEQIAKAFAKKMSLDEDSMDSPVLPDSSAGKRLGGWRVQRKHVLKILQGLNQHKSVNGISPRVLKECATVLADPITNLFKRLAREAKMPELWKVSRVTPLHKRDSVKDPENYRPVSVLPNIAVVFERVLDAQFDRFVRDHIPGSQFGFLRGCGTDDYGALLSMTLSQVLESRQEALVISLDVKGAFDKVWWQGLLEHLRSIGVCGRALRLIQNYLSDRFLVVVAGGEQSERHKISSGVPQGAIWSPKLWNLFVRLLPAEVRAMVFSYADDTALVRVLTPKDTTPEGIIRVTAEVNQDLEALVQWGKRWGLTFEPKKNEQMVVSLKQSSANFPGLQCEGLKVKVVDQMKLVGFVFDSKLKWAGMVDRVRSKARCRLGALFRMCGVLDSENKGIMYKAFIRSVMEYGCLSYFGASKTHLAKLDAVQKRAERICGCKFESLQGRRDAASFGLICKLLDDGGRGDLNLFKPELSNASGGKTRSSTSQDIKLKPIWNAKSLDSFKNSFRGSADRVFSKVPQEILARGKEVGWKKVMKSGQRVLSGKTSTTQSSSSKPSTKCTQASTNAKVADQYQAQMKQDLMFRG